jgi:hypothetical protein
MLAAYRIGPKCSHTVLIDSSEQSTDQSRSFPRHLRICFKIVWWVPVISNDSLCRACGPKGCYGINLIAWDNLVFMQHGGLSCIFGFLWLVLMSIFVDIVFFFQPFGCATCFKLYFPLVDFRFARRCWIIQVIDLWATSCSTISVLRFRLKMESVFWKLSLDSQARLKR